MMKLHCDLCDKVMTESETKYQVNFSKVINRTNKGMATFHLCEGCYEKSTLKDIGEMLKDMKYNAPFVE